MTKLYTPKILLILLMNLFTSAVSAHDIEVKNADGVTIYYNYDSSRELAVVFRGDEFNSYLNEYSGNVVIPETVTYNGIKYSVTTIGSGAFERCSGLTSVTIPSSVTYISYAAFWYCTGLKSITIPNSVTYIGQQAFWYCSGLKTITIPNSVTSIGNNAFGNTAWYANQANGLVYAGQVAYTYKGEMSANTTISIKEGTIAIAGAAFQGCSRLTSISIPKSLTSIGGDAFEGCSGLTSIKVESGNTKYDSRDNCNAIIETVLNTLKLGCKNTVIPNSVTSIGTGAFQGCSSLTSITIPNSVTSIGWRAFENCSGLKSITIPNSVTYIGMYAFEGCSGLSSIVSEIKSPFAVDCFNDDIYRKATLTVPKRTKAAYQATNGWKNFVNIIENTSDVVEFVIEGINYEGSKSDKTALVTSVDVNKTSVTIPQRVTYNGVSYDVISIVERAFENRSDLEFLSIPSSITSIGEYAFINCGRNITVNLESLEAWCNVDFYHEHSNPLSSSKALLINNVEIRDLVIPNSVNLIKKFAFFECWPITSITIPSSVRKIDSSAFENCKSLTFVSLPNTLQFIGGSAFEGCRGISSITIPSSVTLIGINAFKNCSGLTNVTSEIQTPFDISDSVFEGIASDAILTVPSGKKSAYLSAAGWNNFVKIVEITDKALEDEVIFTIDGTTYQGLRSKKTVQVKSVDVKLINLKIPSSVSFNSNSYQVTSIADNIFKGRNLDYLSLPETITTLTEETFSGCSICAMSWNANTQLFKKAFKNTTMSTDYNFLLYVKSADYAPQTVKNVIVGNTAESITLSDSGDRFYCPIAFTAKKISYIHHFGMETGGNGKGWETIVLPFDVEKVTHSTKGELVSFSNWNKSSTKRPFWLYMWGGKGFVIAYGIYANIPYLIAMPNQSDYENSYILTGDVTFSSENARIVQTTEFNGTFVPTYAPVPKSSLVYALNVTNNYISNTSGKDAGSCFISNLRDIRPFEAYIKQTNSTRGIFGINIDNTTDLNDLLNEDESTSPVDVYSLSGQHIGKLSQSQISELPKGVYIINGKKIVK